MGFTRKTDEEPLMTKLRADAIGWACATGNKDCVNQAVTSYARWMADPENTGYSKSG